MGLIFTQCKKAEGFEVDITASEGIQDDNNRFQSASIKVVNVIIVPFDIHPASCPNPINRKSGGLIPAAILGFEGFDISNIDPTTLKINGVSVVKWAIEDVAEPYSLFIDEDLGKMSCNTNGPDGYDDLTIKFKNKDIASLLDGKEKDEVVKLEITGKLYDGTIIKGGDIVIIVK